MNAKCVLCLSIVAILSPAAWAIIAGFNADIHMDIPGTIANDFHIEGKIKSGVAGGGWNSPPILIGHIDGSFSVFNYSITPDTTDPGQNLYLFKADWSGFAYAYCEILHLGLFFDLECNNLVIDLVGWWTFNGQRLGGLNGGAIPISGFIVEDLPDQGPQQMRILNDSQLGGGIGIPLEIMQMGLVSMAREAALDMFGGSLEKIFSELRLGGMQEQLPWIPIRNARGPINPDNPLQFVPDSFFDIFLEVAVPDPTNPQALFPLQPMHIEPGGVLLSRMLVRFINNAGEPDFRWVWHMHEAHPLGDFGDAPDTAALPGYPTLVIHNGARHQIDPKIFLGNLIDSEANGQPDATATGDDLNNLADEDGVKFLTWPLVPGKWAKIQVTASVNGLLYGWIDFGADNSWAQTGDQVFNAKPLVAGVQTIPFFVPITAKPNCTSFARFRFTRSTIALSYTGYAPNGEVEDYLVKIGENCGIKWVQLPDTTPNGMDISVDQPWTLADDFLCTSTDTITDVHLWGSWLNDKKGVIKKIHLSIHSDDPVGPEGTDPQNEWSKPDKLFWQGDFFAGDFTEKLYATLPEGEFWWDPMMDVGPIPGGDHQIWQVDIKIDPEKAFLQEGSREKPIVYWLDVQVETTEGRFGWKTRRWPDHFNDDAVMLLPIGPAVVWRELRYPPQHPYYQSNQNSIDMAFAITARQFCCGSADLNCDGLVDLLDFAIFASQWLQVAP